MTDLKAADVTSHARKGAAWALIISAAAFPLTYLREYFLAHADDTATLRGSFALLVLFITAIYTFLFPGGRNVFPAYFPKLKTDDERSRFVSGFLYLVLLGAALGMLLITLWPGLLEIALDQTVDGDTRLVLTCLIPFTLVSVLANSIVTGSMSFAWAALLQRAQLLLVTCAAGLIFFAKSPAMTDRAILWLSAAVAVAAFANMAVSTSLLFRRITLRRRVMFPAGCIKFCAFTYVDTVMLWCYAAIDRVFIAAWFGKAELGVYVLMFEIARIIPLAVQQLGHLLLATFSKLLGSDAEETLARSYRTVCRLTIAFYAAVSVTLVLFSRPITSVFDSADSHTFSDHHAYLILLAVVMNTDSLRTINGMTLMAYERMPSVFVSKVLQNIVQFAVTCALVLVWPMGVYGVIIGKGAGHVVSAVALIVATARVRPAKPLLPPSVYVLGQVVVWAAAWGAYAFEERSLVASAFAVVAGWTVLWVGGRFTVGDVRSMIPWQRSRS